MTKSTYVYSDMSKSLNINAQGDVDILYDEEVIIQSIKSIMATVTGERLRNPLGSALLQLLFQPLNIRTTASLREEVRRVVTRHEPRVRIKNLLIEPNIDENIYDIRIEYEIIGLSGRYNFDTKVKSFGV